MKDYEKKRQEFELMFSLEDRMEDAQKAMLMEKLMDEYYLEDHDADTTNTRCISVMIL